jgi:hypothetical protein
LKDKFTLTEEQVVSSKIYKEMEEEIMTLIKRQELEFQKLDEVNLVLLLGKVSKGSRNKADSR